MKVLFRAKSKYSGKYVIGQWLEIENQCFIIEHNVSNGFDIKEDGCFYDGSLSGEITIIDNVYEVSKDTRSINFEDMKDSEDNPIFASLSEDGKGGDIVGFNDHSPLTAMYNKNDLDFDFGNIRELKSFNFEAKVIGIQK